MMMSKGLSSLYRSLRVRKNRITVVDDAESDPIQHNFHCPQEAIPILTIIKTVEMRGISTLSVTNKRSFTESLSYIVFNLFQRPFTSIVSEHRYKISYFWYDSYVIVRVEVKMKYREILEYFLQATHVMYPSRIVNNISNRHH